MQLLLHPQWPWNSTALDSGVFPQLTRARVSLLLQFLLGSLCLCERAMSGASYALGSRVWWGGFIPNRANAKHVLRDNDRDDADLSRTTPNEAKHNRR